MFAVVDGQDAGAAHDGDACFGEGEPAGVDGLLAVADEEQLVASGAAQPRRPGCGGSARTCYPLWSRHVRSYGCSGSSTRRWCSSSWRPVRWPWRWASRSTQRSSVPVLPVRGRTAGRRRGPRGPRRQPRYGHHRRPRRLRWHNHAAGRLSVEHADLVLDQIRAVGRTERRPAHSTSRSRIPATGPLTTQVYFPGDPHDETELLGERTHHATASLLRLKAPSSMAEMACLRPESASSG